MIHQDHNILKASLIAYHGHLLATFLYDYVVRNCVRMFFYQIEWSFMVGIVLGILFSMVIIWSIVVVYKSNSVKQVTISLILLCIIFLTKLTTGVLGLVHSNGIYSFGHHIEDWIIFLVQMVVFLIGILFTFFLRKQVLKM